MDERYTIKSEYIFEPIDIYPVYEKKYKDMYRLVGYRYMKQKCRCVYYLIEREERDDLYLETHAQHRGM